MRTTLQWVLTSLLLGGCSAFQTVATVPLEEVIENLEAELSRISLASTSDVLSTNPARKAKAIEYIRSRQCAYGLANPLFLSPDPELALDLKGTFSRSGGFKVTGIPVAPTGEINASVAASSENTLKLKVRLVSLTGVAREYLRVMANFLATPNLPNDVKNELATALPKNYKVLTDEIRAIQESFKPADCPPKNVRQLVDSESRR